MSDRDPLEQLATFGTGGPVDPLPAAEVRRLGDRRRARRTALSAVAGATAVLAVAVPAGLWATRDTATPPGPGTSTGPATPTPAATAIPEGFPLDRGAFDFGEHGERRGPSESTDVEQPLPCSRDPLASAASEDRLGFANIGMEFEDYRQLLLYDDAAAASAVLADVEDAVARCATEPSDGMTLTWEKLQADVGAPSVTVRQGVEGAVGGTTYQLTRVGNAILQVAWQGEGGGDVAGQTKVTRAILPAMSIFAPDGDRTTDPSPDPTTSAPVTAEIPADFPLTLDQKAMEGDGGEFRGPGRDVAPAMFTVCSDESPVFSMPYADRLASVATGPEYADSRQLTVYATVDDAVAQMETVRGWLADCPSWGVETSTVRVHRYDADTGYRDSVTWGTTYSEGTGGQVVQVVRVGRAILALGTTGEWTEDSQPGAVAPLTALTRRILPAMCAFTADGC